MPWVVDENKAKFVDMQSSAERKYQDWIAQIPNSTHPRTAASDLGWPTNGTNFEQLPGGRWSIRLSQRDRVLFEIDEGSQTVTIIKVGGHY